MRSLRDYQAEAVDKVRTGWSGGVNRQAVVHATGLGVEAERRPWPGDPRYLVGIDGTIVGPKGWVLKPQIHDGGYGAVMTCTNGRRWWRPVHVMVCEAFHGPRPAGMEVAHGNGDKLDCRPENLSWKTRSENHADKHLHGTVQQGERANNRKLTDQQVLAIRAGAAAGKSCYRLSRDFGMSLSQTIRIVRREAWTHI